MSETSRQHLTNGTERPHRVALIAVVNESCTGCETCIDFCPVDCIDDTSSAVRAGTSAPPVRIGVEECIGCQVCAKVCEELDWNAIEMVSADEFERRFGIRVTDHSDAVKAPPRVTAPVV